MAGETKTTMSKAKVLRIIKVIIRNIIKKYKNKNGILN